MNKFILPALLSASLMRAQLPLCSTNEMQNAWFASHPEYRAEFEKLQEQAAALDKQMFAYDYGQAETAFKKSSSGSYTIPVVFHILHVGGSENISDAQVRDAVDILTEDFSRLNSDTSDVVPDFKNNIGNPQITFALATKDPNGKCTNGIVRHYDNNTDWKYSFSDYKYSWPSNRYLNIYVVRKIGSGTAGYTYLPGSGVPPAADAIVILSTYVGSMGTGNPGTARALTHEVGHWLNLPHTWGNTNQPGVACGDDGVSDTPPTKGYTSCNLSKTNICNAAVVENIQNYMDYAYCQRMFTTGQAVRMQTALNANIGGRNNLSTPSNLSLTGVSNPLAGCAPQIDISVEGYTVCAGKSIAAVSYTSVGEPTSYSWTASNGASVQSVNSASTNIVLTNVGITTITCIAANNAGISTSTAIVDVRPPWADISGLNSESFENAAPELPFNWTRQSSSASGWDFTTVAASGGQTSMFVRGEVLPANAVAILETPSYDFKNNPGALFSFKYAYRKYDASNKDLFIVQASSDCGGTWKDIYSPSANMMSLGSGGVGTALFEPKADEWKLYDQLTKHPLFMPFLSEPNVRFRFFFKEDVDGKGYGNRVYIDEINFDAPVGVNDLTRHFSFNVYPNPSSAELNLGFTLPQPSKVSYRVLSVTGSEMMSMGPAEFGAGEHTMLINEQRQLAPGVYFVNVSINGATMSRKVIIN